MAGADADYVFLYVRRPARAVVYSGNPRVSARIDGREVASGRAPFGAMGDPLINTHKNVLVGVVYAIWEEPEIQLARRVAEICDERVVRVLDAARASRLEAYRGLQLGSSILFEVRWSDIPATTYEIVQQPGSWYYEARHEGDVRFLLGFSSSSTMRTPNSDGITLPTELSVPLL